jgi:phage I-like protein
MNLRILNREFKHPDDGWYQIEAKGFHPAVAEDGTKVLQVIDDKAIKRIVNRFNTDADAGKLSHGREMLIDHEHFKDDKSKETVAYGWASKLRATPDGSGIDVYKPWTATGQKAVDGGDYRFSSTEYVGPTKTVFESVSPEEVPTAIRNRYRDYEFLRPLQLTGLSLTNDPNNKGARALTILNRGSEQRVIRITNFAASCEPADSQQNNNQGQKMKSVCTLLGLSADADESSVHAAVTKLQNRVTTLEPLDKTNTELKNRNTELEGEQCDALMDAHGLDADKEKARREKIKPVLLGLKNRAERKSFLAECCPVAAPAAPRAAGTQVKLHNRDTNAPGAGGGANVEVEDSRAATKIMNRANEIRRDSKNQISLATAVRMAQRELETA